MILNIKKKAPKTIKTRRRNTTFYYHLLLLPGCIFIFIFHYVPMFGLVMAFQDFSLSRGVFNSPFVGLDHFRFLFTIPTFPLVIRNTIVISLGKLIFGTLTAVAFAILLNEIRLKTLKKTIQTISYLPHFLSWVVLASVVVNLFSLDGLVNHILYSFGLERINFMGSNTWFQPLLIFTDVWKGFGYGAIIYLASITSIDPGLHESAVIDGAGKFRRIWHITLPGMLSIILLMSVLNISGILNAGFDQVYNLYSPMVYETGDILDTYIYRVGLIGRQYSLGAAVGFFKSLIGMILLLATNSLAKLFTDHTIF